jgi:hypothetical protein
MILGVFAAAVTLFCAESISCMFGEESLACSWLCDCSCIWIVLCALSLRLKLAGRLDEGYNACRSVLAALVIAPPAAVAAFVTPVTAVFAIVVPAWPVAYSYLGGAAAS